MHIFGERRIGRLGRMLAGVSLMFIGLDLMQDSAAGFEGFLSPDVLPGEGLLGRLAMAGIGLVLVAVIQSSSAGIALTLVLLGSGTVSFGQAAAMVIGMNLGTTVTGFLASLGGGRETLRAAVANLLFNLGTAIVAFPLLGLLTPVLHNGLTGSDDQTALVLFHTGFNVLGTMIFLPLTRPLAALVVRLVPDRPVTLAAALDPRLTGDTGTALDAAARTASGIADEIGRALQAALGTEPDLRPLAALSGRVDPARAALVGWLARITVPPDHARDVERMGALMHLIDHLARLSARADERDRIAFIATSGRLARPARAVAAALVSPRKPGQAARLAARVRAFAMHHRRGALLRQHAGMISPAEVFRETDALRWIDRVAEHAERIAHYGAIAAGPV
jgi:phosphate:Na+ symporter